MGKLTVTGHLQVEASELDAVLKELPVHIELSREEPGCLRFEISKDASDAGRLNLYEEYISPEAFEAHKERAKQSRWAAVSQNVERFLNIAEADE